MLELGDRRKHYSGTIPRLGPLVLADIALARWRLERLAARLDPGAPWAGADAEAQDGLTLADWLGRRDADPAGADDDADRRSHRLGGRA